MPWSQDIDPLAAVRDTFLKPSEDYRQILRAAYAGRTATQTFRTAKQLRASLPGSLQQFGNCLANR